MKTERISTHRIGADSKSRKRKSPSFLVPFVVAVLVFGVYWFTSWRLPIAKTTVQITVIATASPLPTATMPLPTLTALPTLSPVAAPSPAPVFGIALGDVWLRRTAGGERLPAALLKGQRVEILEDDGDYLKIRRTDSETVLTGWVTAAWVEVQ